MLLAAVILGLVVAPADAGALESYTKGVALIESGKPAEARAELERARHPDDIHLVLGQARARRARQCTLEQSPGDELVVAAHQDGHASHRAESAGVFGHESQWARRWPSLSRLAVR